MAWIEHATSPLPRECSATELHGRYLILYIAPCRSVANNAVPPLFGLKPVNFGAGEGNRTLVISLEGFCSTIELHPQFRARNPGSPSCPLMPDVCFLTWWRGKDSNLRRQSRQIYSLLPLTAREPLRRNRTV